MADISTTHTKTTPQVGGKRWVSDFWVTCPFKPDEQNRETRSDQAGVNASCVILPRENMSVVFSLHSAPDSTQLHYLGRVG